MHSRVLAFILATPLLLWAAFLQLDVKTDISAFFVSGQSAQMKLLASQMQSGEMSRRYLISIVQDDVAEQPLEFIDQLRSEWLQVNSVQRVWSPSMDETETEALIAFYLPFRHQIYSLDPDTAVAEAFTDAAMASRAQGIKQGILSPQGAWVRQIISQDPMFLMGTTFAQLGRSESVSTALSRYSALMVETAVSGLDTDHQAVIKQQLETVFQDLNQTYGTSYKLEMTGVPIFALAIQQQAEKDVTWISSVSVSLMVLLFLLMFRSLQSLIMVLWVLLVSAAMAALCTSLFFGQTYALTLALGTTLIGICVDYPIHTMVHAQGSMKPPIDVAKRIWPSLLLGALTTVVGYTALSFTGYPGLQQVALYSAVGILTALLVSRFILPLLIQARAEPVKPIVNLNGWLNMAQARSLRLPILLVAGLVLGFGLMDVRWQDDLSQLSPSVSSLKEQDRNIRARMHSIEPGRFILIHAKTMQAALELNEMVSQRLKSLQQAGKIDGFYSLYPWLASHKLQQQNQQQAKSLLNNDVQQRWNQALEREGLRSEMFAKAVVPDLEYLELADVLQSPAARYIAGQYIVHDGEVMLTVWLGLHDPVVLKQAFSNNHQIQYVSQKDMMNEMNAAYRAKAVTALLYAALFIVGLLSWRYKSVGIALQVLLPAMVSVALMVGSWGLLAYPLSILHLLGLLLAVAICVDYGIFFHENRSGNIRLTYQAIVISALTTMVAFFCLALADNPALQVLAWSVAPGVLLGFLLCPLLIQKVERK
ncbi:MAG: MMPL family transporter [Mariprofundaceae bacterium]